MVRCMPAALIAVLASVVLACAPAPATTPSATPSPSAPAAFPATTGEVLVPGRYDSQPPFNIPFTFEAPAGGWESMHLHGEFFDIGRFEGEERQTAPARWIAFGDPENVRGTEDVPDSDLTATHPVHPGRARWRPARSPRGRTEHADLRRRRG